MTWVSQQVDEEIAVRFSPEALRYKLQEIVVQKKVDPLFRRIPTQMGKKRKQHWRFAKTRLGNSWRFLLSKTGQSVDAARLTYLVYRVIKEAAGN